jgi:hypothetical protein
MNIKKDYLTLLRLNLLLNLFKKDKNNNLIILNTKEVLSKIKEISNKPYFSYLKAILNSSSFNSKILAFAFHNKNTIKSNYDLKSFIMSIQDEVNNDLGIKSGLDGKFIKTVVLIYIRALKETYSLYSKLTSIHEPDAISDQVATEKGFIYKEFHHSITKNDQVYNIKGCEIVSYTGNESNLSIPTKIGNLSVLKIKEKCFDSKMNLIRIWIKSNPNLIIEPNAFYNCKFLINIIVDQQLNSFNHNISQEAFLNSFVGKLFVLREYPLFFMKRTKPFMSIILEDNKIETSKTNKVTILSETPNSLPRYITKSNLMFFFVFLFIFAFSVQFINLTLFDLISAGAIFTMFLFYVYAFRGLLLPIQKLEMSNEFSNKQAVYVLTLWISLIITILFILFI